MVLVGGVHDLDAGGLDCGGLADLLSLEERRPPMPTLVGVVGSGQDLDVRRGGLVGRHGGGLPEEALPVEDGVRLVVAGSIGLETRTVARREATGSPVLCVTTMR